MTTDKALEILGMSEQARWRSGYEPTDEKEAIETIREALEQSNRYRENRQEGGRMTQTRINVPHIPRFDIHVIKPSDKDYPECMKLVPHNENYDLISIDNLIVVPLVQVIDVLSKRG